MNGPLRRGGRYLDPSGRPVSWSVAEGGRGRRWRWTISDRLGGLVASHTLEAGPDGRFSKLESASRTGLLTLHREPDGSVHGNRLTEIGVDHLTIEAPVPDLAIVGGGGFGIAPFMAGFLRDRGSEPKGRVEVDVIEVFDDLGVRVISCTVHGGGGEWQVRTNLATRRMVLGADGLPADEVGDGVSWPLERVP